MKNEAIKLKKKAKMLALIRPYSFANYLFRECRRYCISSSPGEYHSHLTGFMLISDRYRLMLRRCLEQETPAFGMMLPASPGGTTDYGTMLEIRSVQMLPDGRSMVETFGAHRFRIVERGTIDGYMVGRVERIEDIDGEIEVEHVARLVDQNHRYPTRDRELSNEELLAICVSFVEQLRSGMAPWVVQRLNHTYGPMPDDISSFTFWMGLASQLF